METGEYAIQALFFSSYLESIPKCCLFFSVGKSTLRKPSQFTRWKSRLVMLQRCKKLPLKQENKYSSIPTTSLIKFTESRVSSSKLQINSKILYIVHHFPLPNARFWSRICLCKKKLSLDTLCYSRRKTTCRIGALSRDWKSIWSHQISMCMFLSSHFMFHNLSRNQKLANWIKIKSNRWCWFLFFISCLNLEYVK